MKNDRHDAEHRSGENGKALHPSVLSAKDVERAARDWLYDGLNTQESSKRLQ